MLCGILQFTFNFPAKHIKDVSPVAPLLFECIIDIDSYPELVKAFHCPERDHFVVDKLDVSKPVDPNEDEAEVLAHFRERITKSITRFRASKTKFHKVLAKCLESYRDEGKRTWDRERMDFSAFLSKDKDLTDTTTNI